MEFEEGSPHFLVRATSYPKIVGAGMVYAPHRLVFRESREFGGYAQQRVPRQLAPSKNPGHKCPGSFAGRRRVPHVATAGELSASRVTPLVEALGGSHLVSLVFASEPVPSDDSVLHSFTVISHLCVCVCLESPRVNHRTWR